MSLVYLHSHKQQPQSISAGTVLHGFERLPVISGSPATANQHAYTIGRLVIETRVSHLLVDDFKSWGEEVVVIDQSSKVTFQVLSIDYGR